MLLVGPLPRLSAHDTVLSKLPHLWGRTKWVAHGLPTSRLHVPHLSPLRATFPTWKSLYAVTWTRRPWLYAVIKWVRVL